MAEFNVGIHDMTEKLVRSYIEDYVRETCKRELPPEIADRVADEVLSKNNSTLDIGSQNYNTFRELKDAIDKHKAK